MKKEVGTIDAMPSKRLYLSIIADYDLNRSICELIDNALDIWIKAGKINPLKVQIDFDKNQQTICISDNAGGVKKDNLRVIVGPGHTTNEPTDEVIGIFGVGAKRAVVALAQDIKITTRYGKDKTYLLEFDDSWLKTDEKWILNLYEVDDIAEGTTKIELQKLRAIITDDAISHLKLHLQSTYARFLSSKQAIIMLGQEAIEPRSFENWAYPPDYEPRRYSGDLLTEEGETLKVEVLAGLTLESSPSGGEYGVYFYCNDRLIARGLKTYEVGFTKGLAGQPHSKISLTRVIVSLKGKVQLMPWNSSKSGIDTKHRIFVALRNWIVEVVTYYASLSRRFEGDWPEKVFKYPKGQIVEHKITNIPLASKSYLPSLPKSKLRYGDLVEQENRAMAKEKPWTKGIYEGIIAVDLIYNKKWQQKNRICLMLLDSTLEIAFKEFLVHESGEWYKDEDLLRMFRDRNAVQKEVQRHIKFNPSIWNKINFYYALRNKLVHERITVGIHDFEVENYRELVQEVLTALFKLQF